MEGAEEGARISTPRVGEQEQVATSRDKNPELGPKVLQKSAEWVFLSMESPVGSPSAREYVFGPFRVDTIVHQLFRDDQPILLSPKVFDLLLVLITNRHRVVEKADLLKQVWPDTFASDDSLIQAVSAVRRALGDDSTNAEYIATIPKRGYRFIAPVLEHSRSDVVRPVAPAGSSEDPVIDHAALDGRMTLRAAGRIPRWAASLIVIVAIAAPGAWFATRSEGARFVRPVILFQVPPRGTELASGGVLSPDGRLLAFVARDPHTRGTSLWVRPLDAVNAHFLPGTEGASRPFWSPNSASLGFFADRKLKIATLKNDAVRTLVDLRVGSGGGAWSANGTIIFADRISPLYAISASGGEVRKLTTVDQRTREQSNQWPSFLPDGHHYLFDVRSSNAAVAGVYVADLDSNERMRLLDGDNTAAIFAPPGYLLYIRDNTLMAQQFDPGARVLRGSAVAIASDITRPSSTNEAVVSVSSDGLLSVGGGPPPKALVWYERDGRRSAVINAPVSLFNPQLLPTGMQLLAGSADSQRNGLWLVDLERGTPSRMIPGAGVSVASPDGRQIAFASGRGLQDIYLRRFGVSNSDELIVSSPEALVLNDWSKNDDLVYATSNARTKQDLWLLPMTGDRKPRPYLASPDSEMQGKVSPDGQWIAYTSDESGRWDVYVDRFPNPGATRTALGSGAQPQWRSDGRELFFVGPDNTLMAVDLVPGTELTIGAPRPLFRAPMPGNLDDFRNQYVVAKDGKRFLIVTVADNEPLQPIQVIFNWTALLPS